VDLRYGMNPQQLAARATPSRPGRWPVRVLRGSPSYTNMLDALNGWQLVREASHSLGRPAAASFKHVSPSGAAVAGPVDEVTAEPHGVPQTGVGALTSAYVRARDADPCGACAHLPAGGPAPGPDQLADPPRRGRSHAVREGRACRGALAAVGGADRGRACRVAGGSTRSEEVELACREHRITLARTGLRPFHH
jgi:AICAR transformylase/IMP cyclohydrolase PurH